MKPTFWTTLLAIVTALAWSSLPSMAQTGTTTFQTYNGNLVVANPSGGTDTYTDPVINSTYTFSLPTGKTSFDAAFEQTSISRADLNAIAPPVEFELQLTTINYVDTSTQFVGNGSPVYINVDVTIDPTINQADAVTAMATLVSDTPITGTVTGADFHLVSPVVFPFSEGTNIGNLASTQNGGGPTWLESVSNIGPEGSATVTIGSQTSNYNYNANNFSLGGSVEVIYAVPEPTSCFLGFVGMGIFVVLYRRHHLRD